MSAQDVLTEIASIPRTDDEPVFAEPWEARAFAMAVSLNEAGLFEWPEWAARFGAALEANTNAGGPLSYYQVWLQTLEAIMAEKQIASADAVSVREKEWADAAARTPHGQPIEL
jgi:nitrile hydratase accessory protein